MVFPGMRSGKSRMRQAGRLPENAFTAHRPI
jgi:hypothetical protein